MSSTYRIMCLNHDPAIALEPGWESGDNGLAAATQAILNPGGFDETEQHTHCDLVIGKFSYPLVEVGTLHGGKLVWRDAAWLRLLALTQLSQDGSVVREAARQAERHWPQERLRKLRYELGIEEHVS